MKSGLLKRGKWYSVRILIPTDLRELLQRKEIVKSLQTNESKQARLLHAQFVSRVEDLFFRMRAGMMDKSTLTQILKSFADNRLRIQETDLLHVGSMDLCDEYDTGPTVHYLRECSGRLFKDSGKGLLTEEMLYSASKRLEEYGVKKGKKEDQSPEFIKFARNLAQVEAIVLEELANRAEGKFNYNYQQSIDGLIAERMSVTLKEACDDYIAQKTKEGLKLGTLTGYQCIIKSILEFYGDDFLVKDLHNKKLLAYVESQQTQKIKNRTISEKVKRLKDIVKLACINYGLPPWQYQIKLKDDSLDVKPLTAQDLYNLFVCLNKLNKGVPWQYWITLIALLTGLRQEEVTGLEFEDIEEVRGVWRIRVNDGKSENAARLVPVSDVLLNLGILEFWEQRKKSREPFPFMFHYNGKYGRVTETKVSDWFTNLKGGKGKNKGKGKLGLGEEKRFHSLRHNFADALKQGGVGSEMREELCGHKITSGDSEQGTYTEAYRLPLKQAAINKAVWDCDFSILRTWKVISTDLSE